jgi:predicted transposase/invertase (TIGR01784 family)
VVRNNELPAGDSHKKAERLDVNCRINDGSQVDMEMQASNIEEELGGGHKNLKGKSIYYLCDLHASQPSIGIRYDRLVRTYQVTFCSYTIFPKRKEYMNTFSLRHDEDNELLSDAVCVAYVELSKLNEILKKPVNGMTELEKWAVFFKYADIPAHREQVNKIIESKEALQMAGDLLMSISQDERERAIYRSQRMFQTDMASNIATAEDRGEKRGEKKGRAEGELAKALAIARNMIRRKRPIEEIIEDTGLTREEIENLSV